MQFRELLLPEFDHEIKSTRKILERVPVQDGDWKPHGKSMSMGQLASHIAALPHWGVNVLSTESYDLQPGAKEFEAADLQSLLPHFDNEASAARKLIADSDDEHFTTTWRFLFAGHQVFSEPRYKALRTLLLNHLIHHRGQLSVYLRFKDVPVPGMYGPSADES